MVATSKQLREKAKQCRELADTAMTEEARLILKEIALKYEAEASEGMPATAERRLADMTA